MASTKAAQVVPGLVDVSETMLWALHNRASEAARPDGVLTDPECLRIHKSIDYDFGGQFGEPAGILAARAAEIDRTLERWIARHPDGIVVSLGEGLETQARRVDNGRIRWLSVDLPDAIRLREHFLPPTHRFRHIAISALDLAWMDQIDPSDGVFIVAQGLLMYLQPKVVRGLFTAIAARFPAAQIVFDVVPRWFSRLTLRGLNQTPQYRLPPMPWGINRNEIDRTLRLWMPRLANVTFLDYRPPRGLPHAAASMIHHLPFVRNEVPCLVHVALANEAPTSNIITFGKPLMSSLNGVLDAATRNASSGNELAISSSQIIAKRVALGMAAAFDPLGADHAEFGRMMPEKMEAFSAAGMIMLQKSSQAGEQITRFAEDAINTMAQATFAMARCATPAAMAETQSRFALAWFERAASNFFSLGILALGAQQAAMVPLQQTVAANAERLVG
jgi:O-methyltransferase involved in polyketide biosynthesis